MTSLDELDLFSKPSDEVVVGAPRKCRHIRTWRVFEPLKVQEPGPLQGVTKCGQCGKVMDESQRRRGKSSRRLGHDGERRSEKRYGWRKVGEYGGITDLEGTLAIVQQKTSRRAPPAAWLSIFRALETRAGGRVPLVLLSFVRPGVDTEDFIVIRGRDWLNLHGRDT